MPSQGSPLFEVIRPYIPGGFKSSGDRDIMICCPFHGERHASLAINTENGLWICHGCGLSGGIAEFLRLQGVSRAVIDRTIGPLREEINRFRRRKSQKHALRFQGSNPFRTPRPLPESLLGMYDWKPQWLVDSGFSSKLLRIYDVGFDTTQKRITFPIRDLYGDLAGIAGRATIPYDEPRYKIYRGGYRVRSGHVPGDFGALFDMEYPKFETEKSKCLWNAHRVRSADLHGEEITMLIIVEGYKAGLWVIQNGFKHTVALMGTSMSVTQEDMIIRMCNHVCLFLDGDDSGMRGTAKAGLRLSRSVRVSVCRPEFKKQPDDYQKGDLSVIIQSRERFHTWLRRGEIRRDPIVQSVVRRAIAMRNSSRSLKSRRE